MKKILFVGSEATPFAATGGLGDVMGSLPAALKKANPDYDVRVVMPLYDAVKQEYREKMTTVYEKHITLSWRWVYCGIRMLEKDGVIYYFVDNEYYFKRGALYGQYDDGERFAFFSKAVVEMLPWIDFYPDVLHANDWQSALSIIYLRTKFHYPNIRTVFTIHNIEYQGKYGFEILGDVFDLGPEHKSIVEFDNCINLMKGAIVCADKVTTVSEKYAEEITTEYFGTSLHKIIEQNRYKLSGIVNGIDDKLYNPLRDKTIPATFSKTKMDGKSICKAEIQKIFNLPQKADIPVVAMISRLTSHKGFDLVKAVMNDILADDVQFVLLGSGDKELEDFFADIAYRYPDKAGIALQYNKDLAKLIYAGADIFLMPSKSEPCGLAQMMASRYGTVPVVHEVGGLYDTIKPYDHTTGSGNGFTFYSYNSYDMLDAIRRAEGLYHDKKQWKKLVKNAMSTDFSWQASAVKYAELYNNF